MKYSGLALGFICLLAFAALAGGTDTDLAKVPEATRKLFDQFRIIYTKSRGAEGVGNPELVKQLAAAPDADLGFLNAIEQGRDDWRERIARE